MVSKKFLEDVFKLSGVPTDTFVKPTEYAKLTVSLRTKGRGLVVEGPSGIGKTTSVKKALEELGLNEKVISLTARKQKDRDTISKIHKGKITGIIIIDDFHRLNEIIRKNIADYMKTLADEENGDIKLIIVGINKAGDSLVKFASDLNNRIDTIKFETNPDEKILELIKKGENALNINFIDKDAIVAETHGSFHLTQYLCHETCIISGILEECEKLSDITTSILVTKDKVYEDLSRVFFDLSRKFATGPKLRKDGRAPYFHILYWLAMSNEWTLSLDQAMIEHPENRGSISQIVEKKYLINFLMDNDEFSDVLHYDEATHIIGVEDPKFVYFIRNIPWSKFIKQVGYKNIKFKNNYDFALSFAGADRDVAENIFNRLSKEEVEVFYDKNEQHRILAKNVEEYLAPIYKSEAQFIIILLSKEYPKKIWTKFESEQFKARFGEGTIIPILLDDTTFGFFDETSRLGGLTLDRGQDIPQQIECIVSVMLKKLSDSNQE